MNRIGEWFRRLMGFAKGHPDQADQMVDRAKRFANERTGNKYGTHIDKGADALRRQYRGAEGGTPPPGTEGGMPPERRP
ncbi:antitoxin [Nonomuraea rhizosphaerae]|uniref:antitoxin n=1 Tax=Nonomuraea rhizosphaerae TaxID=2665663 RepID=UPI001C5FDE9A|nr:antitoxin [Nonomuraea rhizosphaerae]